MTGSGVAPKGEAEEFNTWFRSQGVKTHTVEIVCWSWVEANFNVQVRSGAVYTLTRAWVDRTRNDRVAALEAVVAAQGRHLEQTGEYTAVVEDLPGFGTLADYGLPGHPPARPRHDRRRLDRPAGREGQLDDRPLYSHVSAVSLPRLWG